MKISISWIGKKKRRYCPYCKGITTKRESRLYFCKKCDREFKGKKIELGLCTLRLSLPHKN